ncbi:hypothetical protein BDD12DRAFT_801069 [Trichophaea hybrida]|nr:hypothetical protein BDD12DRAFT_801069 [Trichophaea hybrida]
MEKEWNDVGSSSVWICTKVLFVLSTLLVIIRLYTRLFIVRFFGADDGLIVLATIVSIAGCNVVWKSFQYGLGQPFMLIPLDDTVMLLKLLFSEYLLYLLAAHCIRASLVVLYRRLTVSQRFHNVCFVYLGLNLTAYTTFTFITIFMCSPTAFYWDKSIEGGKCLDPGPLAVANGWLLIVLDIGALLLPVTTLWKMQLPRKQKLCLIGLFGLGFFVCIASINRLYNFAKPFGMSNEIAHVHAWTLIEVNCGLIAASIPALKPLISKCIPSVMRTLTKSLGQSSSQGNEHGDSIVPFKGRVGKRGYAGRWP